MSINTAEPFVAHRPPSTGSCGVHVKYWLPCIVWVLLFAWTTEVDAAESASTSIHRAYVPADNPEVWPNGRWHAIPVEDYRKLISDLDFNASSPPNARLQRVTYKATWSGESFLNGTLVAEMGLQGGEATYAPLGQPTMSLSDLSWDDRPAIWGTDPKGNQLLRIEADREVLSGRWSLHSQERLGELEFHAKIPSAVLSRFELKLPARKHIEARNGLVAVSEPDEDPEWKLWRLELGRETTLHFVISEEQSSNTTPHLIVERHSRYQVLSEDLRFRTSFTIDHSQGEINQLSFSVPLEMQVSTIGLGNDLDLPFEVTSEDGNVRLDVPLTTIAIEPRASFVLEGTMPLPTERTLTLPRISLHNAHHWKSHLSLDILRPMELADFTLSHCRLISAKAVQSESDSLEIEDWAETSKVLISLDTPHADLACDVLTSLSLDLSQTMMRTLLRLSTRTGSTYRLTCEVPSDWQVTRVASIPRHRPNAITQWKQTRNDEGQSELGLEFRDALAIDQPLLVEVWARRRTGTISNSLLIPVIRPADSLPDSIAVTVHPASGQSVDLPGDSSYQERSLAEATSSWTTDLDGSAWLMDSVASETSSGTAVTLFSENPVGDDYLNLSSRDDSPKMPLLSSEQEVTTSFSSSHSLNHALTPRSDAESSPTQLAAQVTVETFASNTPKQPCVHLVRYILPASAAGRTLRFSISDTASFITLRANGSSKATLLSNQTAFVQLFDNDGDHRIELEYQTPFSLTLLSGGAEVPLPRSMIHTSAIDWRLHLPSTFRINSETTGTCSEDSTVTWIQRFIGPLGRETTPVIQNSEPNNNLSEKRNSAAFGSRIGSESPFGAAILQDSTCLHTRSVPFSAQILHLAIWRSNVSRQVGWLLFATSCMLIGLIRSVSRTNSVWISSLLILIAGTLTTVASDSYATPCGGLFLGTLVGALFPQSIWRRPKSPETTAIGSTRNAPGRLITATSRLAILHSNRTCVRSECVSTDNSCTHNSGR